MNAPTTETTHVLLPRPNVQLPRARTPYCLLFAVFVGSILPKFIGLDAQSFWIDELNVIQYIGYPSFGQRFFSDITREAHPPLYWVLMWCYGNLLGTSEIVLRLSSVLPSVASVFISYFLVTQLYGRSVAIMTTALFGMSSTALLEAQTVRPYSLIMFLSFICTIMFVHAVREIQGFGLPRKKTFWLLWSSNLVLTLIHYSGVFLVTGQAICISALLVRRSTRRALLFPLLLGSSFIPACVWLVWSLSGAHATPMAAAISAIRLTDAVSPIRAFFGQPTLAVLAMFPLLTMRTWKDLLPRLPTAWDRARSYFMPMRPAEGRAPVWPASFTELWALIGLVALQYGMILTVSLIQPPWMQNKNLYPAFPAAYVAFAIVLSRTRVLRTRLGPAFVTTVAAIGLVSYLVSGYPLQKVSFYSPFREQVREAARLIIDVAKPQDTVMFGAVDMWPGIVFNNTKVLLKPTQIYTGLIEQSSQLLQTNHVMTMPPAADLRERRAALERAVSQRDPAGSIIIDLPHGYQLTPDERSYLQSVSKCVIDRRFVNQEVVIANFASDRCKDMGGG